MGGSALDTPNGAEEVCRKNGGYQVEADRMSLFSEKFGNGEGELLENGGSLKEGRATAREILFITINVIIILIVKILFFPFFQFYCDINDKT